MSVAELGQILEKLKVTFKVKESLDFILLWKKGCNGRNLLKDLKQLIKPTHAT